MQETAKIWMNGELVDWADATVHVGVHGLHYGTGVFEGIRAYETPKGPAVFRLADHMQRLHDSARLLYMDIPYSVEELRTATHELVRANGLPAAYIRPIAFFGYGSLGVHTRGNPVETVIMSWPWGAYLGEDALAKGITAKVSSWKRVGPNVIPHVSKATGIYLNSMLATTEAQRAGYDEGILLTDNGFVADGPGENIFVVKNGRIVTPPLSTSILPGITRDSVIQIAQDLGYVVDEADMIRADLALADEVFMTGTAAEVTPVRAVDDVELGVGPVTLEIQRAYLDVVNGRSEQWSHWLDVVETFATPSQTSRPAGCLAPAGHLLSCARAQERCDDAVLVVLGQRRPARQAEPALEQPSGDVAAERVVRREDRLEVHRLPERPRLDVLGLEREPDRLTVGPEGRGVDDEAREPGVRRPVGRLGHERDPGCGVEQLAVAVPDPPPASRRARGATRAGRGPARPGCCSSGS